ncbi:pPIWI_RE_Y domain-containing protein [Streptomyces goshikiensis]
MPLDDSVTTGRSQEVAQSALEVLAKLARALIILSRRQPPHSFALPYPSVAQSALDQIVLRCVLQEKDPPESLPALISWCRTGPSGSCPSMSRYGHQAASG